MFGGGEEFFQDPPSYDSNTLRRFCAFSSRLRRLEKPGKKAIADVSQLAREVGDSPDAYELVVGAVFRHIKTWNGSRQLACWYVLDKLCKECPDKYGFCASKYVLEIGRDYMPFEDPDLRPKYEALVEHWENVFPRHVVDAVWLSKKERLWAAQHPEEFQQQLREEEEEWRKTELEMQEMEGLNTFGQPCINYLQGRCSWGDQCTLYHPPGEEGTLPPECRMGDWKCFGCGVINRHFRRRCANCVREKPQYKRLRQATIEDRMLSAPDPVAMDTLKQQFGYNPYETHEAVAHWKRRLASSSSSSPSGGPGPASTLGGASVVAYLNERKAAYKVRLLGLNATNALESRCQHWKHFPEPQLLDATVVEASGPGVTSTASAVAHLRAEQLIPPGTSPDKAVAILAQMILERGVRDPLSPRLYGALGLSIKAVGEDRALNLAPATADSLMAVCTLALTAWNADKQGMSFFEGFFKHIHGEEARLGLTALQSDQLRTIISQFLQ